MIHRLVSLTTAAALLAAGCGQDPTPDPQELLERLAKEGAVMSLGEQLTSLDGAAPVYRVDFDDSGAAAGEEHRAGSGSLVALDDEDAAAAEHASCERSLLLCYRAGTNVLIFEEITPPQQQRLAAALKAIAD